MQPSLLRIRFYLFLFGCVGIRLLFTLLSYYASGWPLFILGLMACLPIVGWLYTIWVTPRDTGIETLGAPIWWKSLRPFHALLWGSFAYAAMMGYPSAWKILLLDTILGIGSFLIHHAQEGNLEHMLESYSA